MSRVQPAKEFVIIYEGMTTKKHEYLLAADLSAAMQGAQANANQRELVVQAVAEVQWRRDA
jgi:hypothetical protein